MKISCRFLNIRICLFGRTCNPSYVLFSGIKIKSQFLFKEAKIILKHCIYLGRVIKVSFSVRVGRHYNLTLNCLLMSEPIQFSVVLQFCSTAKRISLYAVWQQSMFPSDVKHTQTGSCSICLILNTLDSLKNLAFCCFLRKRLENALKCLFLNPVWTFASSQAC